jgi:excisionase family DNA binding protein
MHRHTTRATQAVQTWEKLLTVADTAEILGLSIAKIYELMKQDGLPSYKIRGARRIRPSELQAWLAQHVEGTP